MAEMSWLPEMAEKYGACLAPCRMIEETPLQMLADAYKSSAAVREKVCEERRLDDAYRASRFGHLYRPLVRATYVTSSRPVSPLSLALTNKFVLRHTPGPAHDKCNTDVWDFLGESCDDLPLELFEVAARFTDVRYWDRYGKPTLVFDRLEDALAAVYVGWRRIRDRGGVRKP